MPKRPPANPISSKARSRTVFDPIAHRPEDDEEVLTEKRLRLMLGLVGGFARQERAVPAIVLDHEEANEQQGPQRRHGERKPDLAMTGGDEHGGPERDERQEGDRKLEEAARRARPAIGGERRCPVTRRLRRAVPHAAPVA